MQLVLRLRSAAVISDLKSRRTLCSLQTTPTLFLRRFCERRRLHIGVRAVTAVSCLCEEGRAEGDGPLVRSRSSISAEVTHTILPTSQPSPRAQSCTKRSSPKLKVTLHASTILSDVEILVYVASTLSTLVAEQVTKNDAKKSDIPTPWFLFSSCRSDKSEGAIRREADVRQRLLSARLCKNALELV